MFVAAFRGQDPLAAAALAFIEDRNRQLLISDYVLLELMPKVVYHRNAVEENFYRGILGLATRVANSDELVQLALEEGRRTGISGIDALHVAAAAIAGAAELITSERSTKPIHRTALVRVVSLAE